MHQLDFSSEFWKEKKPTFNLLHAELSVCPSSAHISKAMELGSRRLSASFKQQEK